MFCPKCGQENVDSNAFCQNCGQALSGVPQNVEAPPDAYTPKKRRTGLIVLIIAGVVVVAGAAVAAILLLGGGDKGIPVEGVWYSEDNGDVLRFRDGGRVTLYAPDDDVRGNYDYDQREGEGLLTLDDEEYDFTVIDDELDVDDMGEYERADDDFDIDDFLDGMTEEVAAVPEDTPVPEITPAPTQVPTPTPEPTAVVETVTDKTLALAFAFGEKTGSYSGELVNGVPHGYGTYSSVNSDGVAWTYEGQWQDGHFEGEGTTTWEDGFVETGTYSGDYLNGQGREKLNGRIQYEGSYLNSEYHGQGALFDYYGEVIYSGTFTNGYITETPEARAARTNDLKSLCQVCSVDELLGMCEVDASQYCTVSGVVLNAEQYGEYGYVQIFDQGIESNDVVISIDYWLSEGETLPEVGQWITVWGTTEYLYSYTSYDGLDMTVPLIQGWIIE